LDKEVSEMGAEVVEVLSEIEKADDKSTDLAPLNFSYDTTRTY
jgi:hypothetical protein